MKKIILISILIACFGLTLNAKNIDANMIIKKDGVSYEKASEAPFTGNAYTFFENGKTKKVVPYYQGVIDGRLTEWRSNGTVKTVAYFRKGHQDGEYIGSYSNGKKSIVAYYREGKQEGEVAAWYSNGRKKSSAYYKNNIQDGEETIWYDNGKLIGTPQQWNEDGSEVISVTKK